MSQQEFTNCVSSGSRRYRSRNSTAARVRNLNNDREVELRVNDRVPLEALNNGRILDVSYAAARQLEMVEDGVVPIEITVLTWGPSR